MKNSILKQLAQIEEEKVVFFLFLLAFSIRFLYFFFHPRLSHPGISSPDVDGYHLLAVNLLKGRGFCFTPSSPTSYRPPLYPLFLAGIYFLFGDKNVFLVQTIQGFLGALTGVAVYYLTRKMSTRAVATLSSLLFSFYPLLIFLNACFLSETLFILLLVLAIFSLYCLTEKPSWRYQLLSGFFLGGAILTRPLLLLFPLLLLPWLIKSLRTWQQGLYYWAGVFLTTVLIYSPWVWRNYLVHQAVVLTTTHGGITFWGGNNKWCRDGKWVSPAHTLWREADEKLKQKWQKLKTEVEQNRFYYQLAFNWLKENPEKVAPLLLKKFLRFWDYNKHSHHPRLKKVYKTIGLLSSGVLFPFMLLGIVVSWKERKKFFLFYLLILYFSSLAIIFYGDIRLRAPLDPFLLIFASLGMVKIWELAKIKTSGGVR